MSRPIRTLVIAVLSLAALTVLVFAFAWSSLPRGWIENQARRQASQVKGASVSWSRMTPAFKGLSIGVTLEGLKIRIPAEGTPKTNFRADQVFVRMKLIPLLFRRAEVSSAMLDGAWLETYEQPPGPPGAPDSTPAARFKIQLPTVDFRDLNIRTRDTAGSGIDLRGLTGHVILEGPFDSPSAIRVSAKAESLYWKPSAAAAEAPMPSPLSLDANLESKGEAGVLRVTKGSLDVGHLKSELAGSLRFHKNDPTRGVGGPEIDLKITGKPQKLDSSDKAFRALAGSVPAKWNGTAAWNIHAGGRLADAVTDGVLNLGGLSVHAQDNSFVINQARVVWNTYANRTFTANGTGSGSGISLSFQAKGLLVPGGSTTGTLVAKGPATRLNGLMPNSPTWRTGDVEYHLSFELRPPAKPSIRWTAQGRGIEGTVQGLAHPVRGLQFDVEGSDAGTNIRSLTAHVASSTLNASGTLNGGKPPYTGTFRIAMDRFIAEEWAPPEGGKAPQRVLAPPPTKLPAPIGAFVGQVDIAEARSGGMRVMNVSTPVRYDGANLVATPIKGSIGTGSFEGTLNIQSLFGKPSYTLHMDVKRAPVEQVASGTMPFSSAVTGFMSGVIDLNGEGLPSSRPNDTLKGLLKGSLEDGRLKVSPVIIAIARSLGITQASDVPVSQETHTIRILGQKMIIDKAQGDLGEDKAEVTGWVGLDHVLDLNVLLKLAPNRVKGSTFLAKFAQYARDSEGRLPITLKIDGPDRAPRIQVNTQALLEAAGREVGKNIGKQILENLVKGIARKPDSVRKVDSLIAADSVKNQETLPKTPADSTAPDPLKQAGDALKRIFGK